MMYWVRFAVNKWADQSVNGASSNGRAVKAVTLILILCLWERRNIMAPPKLVNCDRFNPGSASEAPPRLILLNENAADVGGRAVAPNHEHGVRRAVGIFAFDRLPIVQDESHVVTRSNVLHQD